MHLSCWSCSYYIGDHNLFMRGDGTITNYAGDEKVLCMGCGRLVHLAACDPEDGTEGQIPSLN